MISDTVEKAQVAGLSSSGSQVTPSSFILNPAQPVMLNGVDRVKRHEALKVSKPSK
jgi:hypothetical protein